MDKGLLFWVVWVICLLAWAGVTFVPQGHVYAGAIGGGAIELLLSGLLGWKIFGPVVT